MHLSKLINETDVLVVTVSLCATLYATIDRKFITL